MLAYKLTHLTEADKQTNKNAHGSNSWQAKRNKEKKVRFFFIYLFISLSFFLLAFGGEEYKVLRNRLNDMDVK